MKKNQARRALFMSVLAMLLCVSMFVGTTFAWFTDSVTSANNIIKSGKLDVEMYWADGTKAVPTDDAGWTDASTGAIFDYDLWEPGYTAVRHIKIANVGNLALKYMVRILPNGEVSDLADVIDVYYVDSAVQVANRTDLNDSNKLGTLTEVLDKLGETGYGELAAGNSDTITIALKMQESAGNEYQDKAIGTNFSIVLNATQLTAESDSFDDQYDADAKYGIPEEDGYKVVYIYSMDDFTAFGKAVNNNTKYGGVQVANNDKVWVEVMNDIDMTDTPAIQGTEFAIGNGNNLQFTGVFDGNNHTISNYNIEAAWTYNVSLFRTVSGNFTMCDITFDNCSGAKTNNREAALLVGTIGGGTITFKNVDIKNSTVNGVSGASAYVGKMTEGALYFIDCDVDNVELTASSATGYNGMFLRDGYSHHDYDESGVWVENCTITNSKSVVNGTEETTIKEYNYTK